MSIENKEKIKNFLDYLYETYNNKNYISTDPIRFPHELEGDTEFIAFTASVFAYGNMKAIQGFLRRYFEYAGCYVDKINYKESPDLYYRFQTSADVASYSLLMKKIYDKYGSIGNLFKESGAVSVESIGKGITALRSYIDEMTNGLNFLMPVPGKSASKRLYMFLRWMVRKDEVDFGLWDYFDKTSLFMPSDTHILRMSENLKIIDKNEKGRSAVLKITEFFKEINSDDPAKYDFSLTRLGIVTGCQYSVNPLCDKCIHKKVCFFH